jgi:iron(III) transport system ATP-binding protein
MPILLECQHITKFFGDVPAVDHLNLSVKTGQFTTLLGPSGCGKTTTLRLIAGFEMPDSGTITLNGPVVAGRGIAVPPEQRKIGMVFQEYALFPHLSVADNISFGLSGGKSDKQKRVETLLNFVGLSGIGRRMPYELSGGQQQRVALARALAPQPDILLLDEPFSNLDAALRAQVRSEVRAILKQTQITCIFVTHDQEEALSLSDRVAVMFDGKIAQIDAPQDLYHRPVSQQIAAFIGEANFLPAAADGDNASSVLGRVPLLYPMRGEVRLLIRPEMLKIAETGEGVPAVIKWREFYGHDQRLGLQLVEGHELIARLESRYLSPRRSHQSQRRFATRRIFQPLIFYFSTRNFPRSFATSHQNDVYLKLVHCFERKSWKTHV